MNKRAAEILQSELTKLFSATTKTEADQSLHKIAELANILDQMGNEVSADRLDVMIKEAGFWSALFSGTLGGGGAKLWDAVKGGTLKESLGEIVKGALMGAGAGVMTEYIINGLAKIPWLGSIFEELVGAPKLKSMIQGIIAAAVAESDLANKLVDKTILAVEQLLGMKVKQEKAMEAKQAPSGAPQISPAIPEGPKRDEEGSTSMPFNIEVGGV
jgi:hypothetical protein